MFETFSLCLPPLSQVNTPINILWEWAKGIEEKLHFHALYGGQSWAGNLRKDLLRGCQPLQGCLSGREHPCPRARPSGWLQPTTDWGGSIKVEPRFASGLPRYGPACWVFELPLCPQVLICNRYSVPQTPSPWEPDLRQYCFLVSFYIKIEIFSHS